MHNVLKATCVQLLQPTHAWKNYDRRANREQKKKEKKRKKARSDSKQASLHRSQHVTKPESKWSNPLL